MRFQLRYLLAAAFTVIATVPVLFLGTWVQRTSFEKELAAVREKHLLIADNLTLALERYAKDTEATFTLYVDRAKEGTVGESFARLAGQFGFREFLCLDAQGHPVKSVSIAGGDVAPIPASLFSQLSEGLGGEIRFSPVMNDSLGRPVIYLARRLESGILALGALDTAYIAQLQKAIAFGRKGHAAIVDQQGNLIAHPNPEWQAEHRNLSKLEPVRRMLAGEKGVAQFFSPAVKADMVSGFNTVAGPGWGVMVPQPLAELEERAADVRLVAFALGLAGLAVAAAISWFLAGLLTRPLQAVVTAARDLAGGRPEARALVATPFPPVEITELAEAFNGMALTIQENEARLLLALKELQQADRAKSEFLAAMSHELRTPLNAIIGFSETLHSEIHGPLGDRRYRDYAHNVEESGRHLLAIINDILDISRIEAGELEIDEGVIDVGGMIRSALMLVDRRARQGEVKVHCERLTELPHLRGSEVKLKQALVNILSNAVKFTAPGGNVTLSAWYDAEGGLALRVADSGIGMTAEEVEIALTPFRQVDGRLSRRFDGTGLGLPLAKRLVELHEGTLEIESEPGLGTVVTLRIPATRRLEQAA